MRPNTRLALAAGRQRWLERVWRLKAAGLIARFPQGRKKGVSGRARSPDPMIARAQRLVEEFKMAIKKITAPVVPSEALPTKADKLSRATELALDVVQKILEIGVNPADVKLLAQVKDTALSVIAQQVRVDEGRLRSETAEEQRRSLVLAELAKGLGAGVAEAPAVAARRSTKRKGLPK